MKEFPSCDRGGISLHWLRLADHQLHLINVFSHFWPLNEAQKKYLHAQNISVKRGSFGPVTNFENKMQRSSQSHVC